MAKRGQGEGTISKRPDGTWWARISLGYDAQGKRKRKAFYGKTRKEVQEKLTAALNEVNTGIYIDPTKMTVGQWMNQWMKEYKKNFIKPSTYSNYHRFVNRIINDIGGLPLKELKNTDIRQFLNRELERNMSTASVHHMTILLRGAIKQAYINELIPKNVADGIKSPPKVQKKTKVLTREEQERFVEAAKESIQGEIFLLALSTGMRIGEILALTWNDVDFDENVIYITKTQTEYFDYDNTTDSRPTYVRTCSEPKTKGSKRKIPMLNQTREMLQELLKRSDGDKTKRVFTKKNGDSIPHHTVHSRFKKIQEKAGIEDIHIHSLRHTFATRGLESGIELRVMQDLLGHSSINMTADIYTHVLPDKKQLSIDILAGSITF